MPITPLPKVSSPDETLEFITQSLINQETLPPQTLKECPIESHPFITFLLTKWERLDKEIEDLKAKKDDLRQEQSYLEKLAQEFRDEHFKDEEDQSP